MADEKDIHSTGRGGAGNIGKGEGVYTDGDIVRTGPLGETGRADEPDYSAGRGGVGNIVHDSQKPAPGGSEDYIPETATKGAYSDFHTGRGGEGNIHREKYGGHSKPQQPEGKKDGLLAKAKDAILHADRHRGGNES